MVRVRREPTPFGPSAATGNGFKSLLFSPLRELHGSLPRHFPDIHPADADNSACTDGTFRFGGQGSRNSSDWPKTRLYDS